MYVQIYRHWKDASSVFLSILSTSTKGKQCKKEENVLTKLLKLQEMNANDMLIVDMPIIERKTQLVSFQCL